MVEELDDELCLFDPSSAEVLVLNTTASAIWRLLDGARTIEQVCRALADDHDVETAEVRPHVAALIEQLAGRGLLVEAPESDAT